ncbi:peptidase M4 thermolysin (plasmid) [Emticicia oligotrophica DSM 17448]|uniref:Peptidase M4 thermolysin n=1 Tax=Emticicia oligotrophica (strain DSM 17448 / CIP 109782 / MTCC 6937 / GPTSA100-15) TaxID=929562 RepID=A0ABM5N885_EMTOG|nr:M4 family metallopeptidase [Emticicia oligotrophica]AFK05756.1 peptidase M4 thermolysin [Emticicia oligotrophica DSM 17448]
MKTLKISTITCCIILWVLTKNIAQNPIVKLTDSNGTPTFIEFEKYSTAKVIDATSNPVTNLEALKRFLPVTSQDEFRELAVLPDQLGYSHRKYQQYYNGIKVENSVYTVHSNENILIAMNGHFTPIKNISVVPNITEAQALKNALSYRAAEVYIWNSQSAQSYDKKSINVPKGEIVFIEIGGQPKLAYKFDIFALKPLFREYVFVDAYNGQVLKCNPILKHCFHKHTYSSNFNKIYNQKKNEEPLKTSLAALGNFFTRFNGSVSGLTDYENGTYRLRDYTRGKGIETLNVGKLNNADFSYNINNAQDFTDIDNIWSEYDNTNKDNAALDVHRGTQNFYDYFKSNFARNSIDGDGFKLKSYVHYLGINGKYVNAFWTGNEMFYGDGDGINFDPLTSQDVVAHELAHGFCQYTANLEYEQESGALNEALSDIWGAIIENAYYPTKKTWLIGEDFDLNAKKGFRDMSDPYTRNMPKTYLGKNWSWESNYDNGGVHLNSSVINYWFYLLSQGGSGTNDLGTSFQVKGIGMIDAAKIVYRTETLYLSPSSQFFDFRIGALKAATELFGEKSLQYENTFISFLAVGISNSLSNLQQNYYASDCSIPNYQKVCGFAMTADKVYRSSVFSVSSIISNSSSTSFLSNCNFQFLDDFYAGNVSVAPKSTLVLEAGKVIIFESQKRVDGSSGGLYIPYGSTFKAQICTSLPSSTLSEAVSIFNETSSYSTIDSEKTVENSTDASMHIYPNPSSDVVNINLDLPNSTTGINLFIQPPKGIPIEVMKNLNQEAGNYQFSIPVDKLENGINLIVLQMNGKIISQKLIVAK